MFEIFAVVFELKKEMSKPMCGEAAPREFVEWFILDSGGAKEGER